MEEGEAQKYSKLANPVRHGYSMQRLAAINSPFDIRFAKKKAQHIKEYNKAYEQIQQMESGQKSDRELETANRRHDWDTAFSVTKRQRHLLSSPRTNHIASDY